VLCWFEFRSRWLRFDSWCGVGGGESQGEFVAWDGLDNVSVFGVTVRAFGVGWDCDFRVWIFFYEGLPEERMVAGLLL